MTTAIAAELLPFRCQSFACQQDMEGRGDADRVLFLSEGEPCPDCGATKYLHRLATVHLLERCPENDPAALQGRNGTWKIACGATVKQAKRLTTERDVTDGDGFFRAPIATCHRCRELTEDKQPSQRPKIEV